MGNAVDKFLETLEHPHVAAIREIRALILGLDERIGEEIKWNAPSFRVSEHFATVHLRTKKGVGVILHFGAKKNSISETGVAIADPEGLLQWLAKDRAVVAFADLADFREKAEAFRAVLRQWIGYL